MILLKVASSVSNQSCQVRKKLPCKDSKGKTKSLVCTVQLTPSHHQNKTPYSWHSKTIDGVVEIANTTMLSRGNMQIRLNLPTMLCAASKMASSITVGGIHDTEKNTRIKPSGTCFVLNNSVYFWSGGHWPNSQCKSGLWMWGKSRGRGNTDTELMTTVNALHVTSAYPDNNSHVAMAKIGKLKNKQEKVIFFINCSMRPNYKQTCMYTPHTSSAEIQLIIKLKLAIIIIKI